MKKIFAVLFCLLPSVAMAQIVPSLPYNLTNGTIADANQVMADFNAIVAGVNANAANAGANTNITALNGLTTPLSPSVGGSSVYTSGASAGTANAQTVLTPTPLGFSLVQGRRVTFIAGFSNTASMTLNVSATGAIAVLKQSTSGLVALSGGEVVSGQAIDVWYDGTQYELLNASPQSQVVSCTVIDYAGPGSPSGYVLTDGSTYLRSQFTNLFNCLTLRGVPASTINGSATVGVAASSLLQIGWFISGSNLTCNSTILGIPDSTHITVSVPAGGTGSISMTAGPNSLGDCSTTFTVPNYQGRITAMADPVGNALTSTTCVNPGSIGNVSCGAQAVALSSANIPSLTSVNASQSITVTVPGTGANRVPYSSNGDLLTFSANNTGANVSIYSAANNWAYFTSLTSNNSISTAYTNGSLTAVNKIPPIALVTKAIKF